MKTYLVYALALSACASAPEQPNAGPDHLQLLRDACLATEMRRDAYEQLSRERGWKEAILVVRAGDPRLMDTSIWESRYGLHGAGARGAPSATFLMSGETAGADPSYATYCAVMADEPAGNWRSRMERFASELDMRAAPTVEDPDVLEARAWSTDADSPLTFGYKLYDNGLVVRIARPSTTNAQ